MQLSGPVELYGKVESGVIRPNMKVTMLPTQDKLTISQIQDEEDRDVAFAGPGESVKLIVKNIDYDRIKRGNIICGMQFWAMECEEFVAEIDVLELPSEMLISPGF